MLPLIVVKATLLRVSCLAGPALGIHGQAQVTKPKRGLLFLGKYKKHKWVSLCLLGSCQVSFCKQQFLVLLGQLDQCPKTQFNEYTGTLDDFGNLPLSAEFLANTSTNAHVRCLNACPLALSIPSCNKRISADNSVRLPRYPPSSNCNKGHCDN